MAPDRTPVHEATSPPGEAGRWLWVTLLVAASLIPLFAGWQIDARYPGDDPLITLTYAKNLAAGNGFVFNQPPPVLGTTSPLLALAVAAATVVTTLEPTAVAQGLGVVCWLGLVWVFWVFRGTFGLPPAAACLIGALLAVRGWPEHLSMEAYLFALLSVLAAAAVSGGRPLLAGTVAGALFLVRGEGLLFAGLLAAFVLAEDLAARRRGEARPSGLPRYLGGVAAVFVAWTAYAMPTFGGILPNTLSAKVAQVESGLWAPFAVRFATEWLPGWAAGVKPWFVDPMFVLTALGAVLIAWRFHRLAVFVLWGGAYSLAYHLLGVPGYPWYRLPVEFVLTVCAGVGLGALVGAAWRRDARGRARHVVIVGAVVLALAGLAWPTVRFISAWSPDDRDLAYSRLAQWFRANADPAERVAYFEVGYLGYGTDLGVLDLVGLVSPSTTAAVASGDFGRGFWLERPEYLVQLEGSGFTNAIVRRPEFAREYRAVAAPARVGDRRLIVHRRLESSAGSLP